MRPDWNAYFLGLAFTVAKRSDDPHTHHGCVLVDSLTKVILSTGYNNTIAGMAHSRIDLDRPHKYKHMIHAEENAIMNSAVNLKLHPNPIIAYQTGKPCVGVDEKTGCLEKLIQVGVRNIYTVAGDCTQLRNEESDKHMDFLISFYGVRLNYMDREHLNWLTE